MPPNTLSKPLRLALLALLVAASALPAEVRPLSPLERSSAMQRQLWRLDRQVRQLERDLLSASDMSATRSIAPGPQYGGFGGGADTAGVLAMCRWCDQHGREVAAQLEKLAAEAYGEKGLRGRVAFRRVAAGPDDSLEKSTRDIQTVVARSQALIQRLAGSLPDVAGVVASRVDNLTPAADDILNRYGSK